MKEKIPGHQLNQAETQQPKSNVIDFEAERKKHQFKGKKSLQGSTTVEGFDETREHFNKAHQKALKDFGKGTTQTMLFVASPFVALVGWGFVNYMLDKNLDKKEVLEPPRIEVQEQGRESHPSPVPGVPCP